jgi:hypothetical protein
MNRHRQVMFPLWFQELVDDIANESKDEPRQPKATRPKLPRFEKPCKHITRPRLSDD